MSEIKIPVFSGHRAEDVEAFIRGLERYFAAKASLSDKAKMILLRTQLHGLASADYDDQFPEGTDDIMEGKFMEVFKERIDWLRSKYVTDALKARWQAEIQATKMRRGESPEEYYGRLRVMGRRLGSDEETKAKVLETIRNAWYVGLPVHYRAKLDEAEIYEFEARLSRTNAIFDTEAKEAKVVKRKELVAMADSSSSSSGEDVQMSEAQPLKRFKNKGKPTHDQPDVKKLMAMMGQMLEVMSQNFASAGVSTKQARHREWIEGRMKEGACFGCGEKGHVIKNCPKKSQKVRLSLVGDNLTNAFDNTARRNERPDSKASIEAWINSNKDYLCLEPSLCDLSLNEIENLSSTEDDDLVAKTVVMKALTPDPKFTPARILVEVNGIWTEAIVDSGASTTVLTYDLLVRAKLANRVYDGATTIVTAGGLKIKSYGRVKFSIRLGNVMKTEVEAVVLDVNSYDLLLGNNWLQKVKAILDYGVTTLFVHHEDLREEIPLSIYRKLSEQEEQVRNLDQVNGCSTEHTLLVLDEDIKLPARTIVTYKFKRQFEVRPNDVFEPENLVPVHIPSIHFELKLQGSLKIPLCNWSKRDITLKRGTLLGSIKNYPVEEEPVNLVHEEIFEIQDEDLIQISVGNISVEQKERLFELLKKYKHLFARDESELGQTSLTKHYIDTGDVRPIRQRDYRRGPAQEKIIREEVEKMLHNGVIQKSSSPWASPVVLVKKKDGKIRFCVDYRKLNKVTKKDAYPLPRIDDLLDRLGRATIFSSIDLISGYWQILLDEKTKEKSAFVTKEGLYEFLVMPFGLSNAPATFQRLMDQVYSGILWDFVMVYLDDINVYSKDFDSHLVHLEASFKRLEKAGLKMKISKCHFCKEQLEFLGHIVNKDGIEPTPEKLEVVRRMTPPRNRTEVRSFLGFVGYYRRFIKEFAHIARPLHELTKKDVKFGWTEDCQKSFELLKEKLISAPVLRRPDFEKPFILTTDGSYSGLGAVLSQKDNKGDEFVVGYFSRSLRGAEKNYTVTEVECLGVIFAVQKCKHYLLGKKFLLKTDHSALRWLINSSEPTGRMARWVMQLMEYDFEIEHISGKRNPADFPSRNTSGSNQDAEDVFFDAEVFLLDEKMERVRRYLEYQEIPADLSASKRKSFLNYCTKFFIKDSILYQKNGEHPRRVVDVGERIALIKAVHEEGHFSYYVTMKNLLKDYWWEGMGRDVRKVVNSCQTCQFLGPKPQVHRAPLYPIKVAGPFHTVGIDYIGPLPETDKGNRYIVVCVDYLTKWVEAKAVPIATAFETAEFLYNDVIARHGCPRRIISDQGTHFVNKTIEVLCKEWKISQKLASAYHPQTNGLVERFNQTVKKVLAKLTRDRAKNWDTLLGGALFAIRTMANKSTRLEPFYVLYGRHAVSPRALDFPDYPVKDISEASATRELERRIMIVIKKMEATWRLAGKGIQKAQEAMKRFHNEKYKVDTEGFKVGQKVLLHVPNRRGFEDYWKGPYEISEVLNNGSYRLKSVEGEPLRRSFPRERLKAYTADRFEPIVVIPT